MAEERRIVSVLFADVVGSTALGESLDPEDLRILLRRYFEIAREIVAGYGGTVEKFIGDAVVAIFGLPVAYGDDARRALLAALDLRDRVRDDPRLSKRLPIRIAVNTGEVVATRGRSADGDSLLTGDAVNVAARLQQAAEPWTVMIGERTAKAVTGFSLGPAISVEARGKRLPVAAHVLLGRAAPIATRTPMLGRDADLAQLQFVAQRVFREKRPFLVTVIASAGTGKTRLLEEFLDRLPGATDRFQLAIAQCLPYGQRLTYWPLRSVLCKLADIPEEAPPDAFRAGARLWLSRIGIDDAERTSELLAATFGAGASDVADPAALLAAWRNTLEAAARAAPLVLVFEDLHWSSDSLLDLAEFVMQPRSDAAVLMIVLTRPELLDRRPSWGGGRRNYMALALEPLPDDAVAALVRHLLASASPELISALVQRSDGNPFYAGEMVRAIIDRAGPDPDPQAVAQLLATLPDTVQAAVLARLDLLHADERRMLQLGSVFGRSFRPAGVVRLDPELAERAQGLVNALADRDLVRPLGGALTFRHILIRDVAYGTLPRAERARLHAAAAGWLAEFGQAQQEAYAELVAYHYREAAALATALELDGLPALRSAATRWLERAAEAATAAAANHEAARHLRAALDFADAADLLRIHERIGDTAIDGRTSTEAYETALRLAKDAGDRPVQFRLVGKLLTFYTRWQGSVPRRPPEDELSALVSEGERLRGDAAQQRDVATFLVAQAFLPFWRRTGNVSSERMRRRDEDLRIAESKAREGMALTEGTADAALRSAALDALTAIAQDRHRWREALSISLQRLELEDRLELQERVDARGMVSWAALALGELQLASRNAEAGLAPLQPGQAPNWALGLTSWQIKTLALLGRWDAADALAERARQFWIQIGSGAAGYSLRGFAAALDIARAREDLGRIEYWKEVMQTILDQFPVSRGMFAFWREFASGQVERIARKVEGLANPEAVTNAPDLERLVSYCVDRGAAIADETLTRMLEGAAASGARLYEAQSRRALGVQRRDPGELRRALAIFEEARAVPCAARVQCELAILAGEQARLTLGLRELQGIGDLERLAHYERLAR